MQQLEEKPGSSQHSPKSRNRWCRDNYKPCQKEKYGSLWAGVRKFAVTLPMITSKLLVSLLQPFKGVQGFIKLMDVGADMSAKIPLFLQNHVREPTHLSTLHLWGDAINLNLLWRYISTFTKDRWPSGRDLQRFDRHRAAGPQSITASAAGGTEGRLRRHRLAPPWLSFPSRFSSPYTKSISTTTFSAGSRLASQADPPLAAGS